MRDDVGDIAAFYNSDPERERCRLEQNQLEYDLTWRYLNRYLPRQGAILEVGAATGRYTLELARRGYAVTAVDLSTALIEVCRQRMAAEGLERAVAGVEPAIAADDGSYSRLQGKQRELWLDLLDEMSTEPSIIGASRHILYIGKKKPC